MADIDRRMRSLDLLPVTDLGDEIVGRLGRSPERIQLPTRRRRVSAGIVAVAVSASAGFGLWRAFTPVEREPRPSRDPLASIGPGWTELPEPPEVNEGAAWVWAGEELLTWGGVQDDPERDYPVVSTGFSFDPSTRRWSSLPPAPVARSDAHAVWTGEEALFFGGWGDGEERVDGVAFDPRTESWRTIPEAPISPRHPAAVVWTGREMIVWGGGDRDDISTNRSGAAYDPAADGWRPIADAPLGLNLANGMWTGDEMIVFGSLLNRRNWAETDVSVGAAYDPLSDTWRGLPPSDLSPQATSAVWTGEEVLAWDYAVRFQLYDTASEVWTRARRIPLDEGECYPDSAAVGGVVFAFYCGQVAEYDTGSSDWARVDGGLTEATIEANDKAYKLYRFASLVPAGDVVFLAAEGLTIVPSGEPCYGCPGSPTALWAYRPG